MGTGSHSGYEFTDDKITLKQKEFVERFVSCGSGARAYKETFVNNDHSDEACAVGARALLKEARIQEYLREFNASVRTERIAQAQEIQEILTKIVRGEEVEEVVVVVGNRGVQSAGIINKTVIPKDRLKAADLLLKILGAYSQTLNVNIEVPHIIDDIG
jgi:phage terminase small subunit